MALTSRRSRKRRNPLHPTPMRNDVAVHRRKLARYFVVTHTLKIQGT
jgi:hypothetical protein